MPVYEYKCSGCGRTYDVLHMGREKIEDVVCPACHSTEYKKLMSAPSVSMKSDTGGGDACPSDGSCCGGSCGMN